MAAKRKNSREIGKRFERQVAHLFESYGWPTRRAQQYKGTETSADLASDFPLPIECKCRVTRSNNQVMTWLRRAESDAGNRRAVVVWKMAFGDIWAAYRCWPGEDELGCSTELRLISTPVVQLDDGPCDAVVFRPLACALKRWRDTDTLRVLREYQEPTPATQT